MSFSFTTNEDGTATVTEGLLPKATLQILVESEDLDKIILLLKSALSPHVPFTHDLLELSKMAHDAKNWHIQAALDILQEYEHPF